MVLEVLQVYKIDVVTERYGKKTHNWVFLNPNKVKINFKNIVENRIRNKVTSRII